MANFINSKNQFDSEQFENSIEEYEKSKSSTRQQHDQSKKPDWLTLILGIFTIIAGAFSIYGVWQSFMPLESCHDKVTYSLIKCQTNFIFIVSLFSTIIFLCLFFKKILLFFDERKKNVIARSILFVILMMMSFGGVVAICFSKLMLSQEIILLFVCLWAPFVMSIICLTPKYKQKLIQKGIFMRTQYPLVEIPSRYPILIWIIILLVVFFILLGILNIGSDVFIFLPPINFPSNIIENNFFISFILISKTIV